MVVLTSFSPPTEGVRHQQPSTKLVVNGRDVGIGTLYIAESKLAWRNNSTGEGFSLLYPHIAIHAVSRDIEHFGNECLYIMVDTCLDGIEVNEGGEELEEDTGESTEMRFVPDDKGQLDAMYVAMTYCQSQHLPDDVLSDDEYLDADDDDDEGEYSIPSGDSTLINSQTEDSNGHVDEEMEGQFLDAECDDEFTH